MSSRVAECAQKRHRWLWGRCLRRLRDLLCVLQKSCWAVLATSLADCLKAFRVLPGSCGFRLDFCSRCSPSDRGPSDLRNEHGAQASADAIVGSALSATWRSCFAHQARMATVDRVRSGPTTREAPGLGTTDESGLVSTLASLSTSSPWTTFAANMLRIVWRLTSCRTVREPSFGLFLSFALSLSLFGSTIVQGP